MANRSKVADLLPNFSTNDMQQIAINRLATLLKEIKIEWPLLHKFEPSVLDPDIEVLADALDAILQDKTALPKMFKEKTYFDENVPVCVKDFSRKAIEKIIEDNRERFLKEARSFEGYFFLAPRRTSRIFYSR